jgi:hypothetical protein
MKTNGKRNYWKNYFKGRILLKFNINLCQEKILKV